ncbi:hypothetical protein Lal_00023388 [Lupinus albus]|uniref:serine O-acetyltransferase n=1 Tax=Lupinus albus TaxID=3870 RepID=A0A6A5NED2_LUPAL|nr:putative serine O-acetyltransferase [Lupinus albus]KAF1881352.1 hypothetical protein Lal_00023388 [Lupinus albus]
MATCVDSSTTLSQKPNRLQSDDHSFNYMKFYLLPTFSDRVTFVPICKNREKALPMIMEQDNVEAEDLWMKMHEEAKLVVEQEQILSSYYYSSVLSHKSMESALANQISIKLCSFSLPSCTLFDLFLEILIENQDIMDAVKDDIRAVKERDPACISYVHCLLNFKGFLACQAHRVAHKLWLQGRKVLALLIQNKVSEVFSVDIHPGAKIGHGILLDHATGLVVGETAVIGNNVSILHNVTLGGTGKLCGDRHPKIGDGVLIGAGTCILGNIRIGDRAKIGAGSVVLKEVPPRTTVVGNPAKVVGGKDNPIKLDKMPSFTMDHTSHISDWSDYVI